MIYQWWQVKFYLYSFAVYLVSSKYTKWAFTQSFQMRVALASIKVTMETFNHKLKHLNK